MRRTRLLLLLGTTLLLGACAEPTGPSPLATAPPSDSLRATATADSVPPGVTSDYAVSW